MSETATKKMHLDLKDSMEWLLGQSPWTGEPAQPDSKACLLDIRESIEWLLGRADQAEDRKLTLAEKIARQERRLELLIWLLNLERRLPPYGEEQPA